VHPRFIDTDNSSFGSDGNLSRCCRILNAATVTDRGPEMVTTKNLLSVATLSFALLLGACGSDNRGPVTPTTPPPDTHAGARGGGADGETVGPETASESSQELIQLGQNIFRYWTFGDEQQWTDQLEMHTVIESAVDPATALSVGLKVDIDAL